MIGIPNTDNGEGDRREGQVSGFIFSATMGILRLKAIVERMLEEVVGLTMSSRQQNVSKMSPGALDST